MNTVQLTSCLLLVKHGQLFILTLAQRVLHPLTLINVDVSIIVCIEEKKKKVVYSRKLLKDCTTFPTLQQQETRKSVSSRFSIYGVINGSIIYTHVCILVCI